VVSIDTSSFEYVPEDCCSLLIQGPSCNWHKTNQRHISGRIALFIKNRHVTKKPTPKQFQYYSTTAVGVSLLSACC
jgi:hypothetical protein